MSILIALSLCVLATADYQIPDEIEGCDEANAIRNQMIDVKTQADEAAEKNDVLRSNLEALEQSQALVNSIEESVQSRAQSFLQVYDLAAPISFLALVSTTDLATEMDSLNTLLSQLTTASDPSSAQEYLDQVQELIAEMITKTKDEIESNSAAFEEAYSSTLPGLEQEFNDVEC